MKALKEKKELAEKYKSTIGMNKQSFTSLRDQMFKSTNKKNGGMEIESEEENLENERKRVQNQVRIFFLIFYRTISVKEIAKIWFHFWKRMLLLRRV